MDKLQFPWSPPVAASALVCETAAFRLKSPTFSRERSYDRTVLRFAATGERTIPEASYEVNNIHAILLDQHGRLITRRSHETSRQMLLGPQCTWAHELYDEQLSRAASVLYEVETRIDLRRTLFASKLAPVDLDSEARQIWATASDPVATDRLMQLSLATFFNRNEFEIWLAATALCAHDGHRNELEVILLDEAGAMVGNRWMSLSINAPGVGYTDYTIRLEKRIARTVASLEVRGRSEVRVISRVGPILLEDSEKKATTGN